MRFNKLLIILLTLLVVAGVLMVSNLKSQTKDVRALTERVETLEKVIYEKMKQSGNGEKRYSSFDSKAL